MSKFKSSVSHNVWYVNAIRRIVSLDREYARRYHLLGAPTRIRDIPALISLYRASSEIIELLWDSGFLATRVSGGGVCLYRRAPVCVSSPWIVRALPTARGGVDCVDVHFNRVFYENVH